MDSKRYYKKFMKKLQVQQSTTTVALFKDITSTIHSGGAFASPEFFTFNPTSVVCHVRSV
jgi:hypothetical protein